MKQKSDFFRPRPPALGTYISEHAGEIKTDARSTGRSGARRILKSTSRKPLEPRGPQAEKWPKAEETNRRSRVEQDDGGPCVTANALALYQRLKTCRYAELIRLGIP